MAKHWILKMEPCSVTNKNGVAANDYLKIITYICKANNSNILNILIRN